jgi:hypothetical protein
MINSPRAQDLLQRFANFTAISPQTIQYLPIPPFNPQDAQHRRIAELSRQAHAATETERAGVVATINGFVEQVLSAESQAEPPEARGAPGARPRR